ncbi:RnfABCDGE type electron transport complex subunit D [Salidesulfovibrio brasiliensis]|uniref:RnfABCDGE type electron transport complex subunit D n=1 Tax=Salidesulfovibrio brasiliensis TaxID=221711 RepID=UPI0006D0180B|nr:RnfABCDGE type electron transport complex subunit D [Salidesulfovibrio brasiliensis]
MKPIEPLLTVASPPHVHCGRTFKGMTLETILALMPAAIMAVWHFGLPAARVMLLSCAVAVLTEAVCWKAIKRRSAVDDGTAVLIGLFYAFLLPASAPWWLVVSGAAASIILGKMIFGGNGGNPLGAALVGWTTCRISWGTFMDPYTTMLDSPLRAPLHELHYFGLQAVSDISATNMLLGEQIGGLGAAQSGAILLGGLYLLSRRIIRPEIPVAFIGGIALAALVFQLTGDGTNASATFHLIGGGTLFGAFFLATDPAPSPVLPVPMIAYGLMGGILTMLIRQYGMYPDAVPFALLLAQLATPLLERIAPKPFGTGRVKA